nr:MAG TPA: hypothetical protein [Caudoviricetes sp.]
MKSVSSYCFTFRITIYLFSFSKNTYFNSIILK